MFLWAMLFFYNPVKYIVVNLVVLCIKNLTNSFFIYTAAQNVPGVTLNVVQQLLEMGFPLAHIHQAARGTSLFLFILLTYYWNKI